MRLTVLGCSGSVGGPDRPASGYLLETVGGDPVVLDFGPGVLGELQKRVDPNKVALVLSHLHADHCLDLPSLLVWRRYHPVPATGRAALYGPSQTQSRIGAASAESAETFDDISDTFDVRTLRDREMIAVGGLDIEPFEMFHPPEAYGMRIVSDTGKIFAFSGDTAVCDSLLPLAKSADYFLCEASWTHDPGNRPVGVHLSGTEAGRAATEAGVGHLLLTHIPPWTSIDAVVAEARAAYSGPVTAVRVGDTYEI